MTRPSWLDTARAIVRDHQAAYVYTDTGAPIGPGKSEVLQRDYEAGEETDDAQPPPEKPRRHRSCRRVLLDAFTASMLVQIHDALNEKNRAHFASLPLLRAVDLGWKLAKPRQVTP